MEKMPAMDNMPANNHMPDSDQNRPPLPLYKKCLLLIRCLIRIRRGRNVILMKQNRISWKILIIEEMCRGMMIHIFMSTLGRRNQDTNAL